MWINGEKPFFVFLGSVCSCMYVGARGHLRCVCPHGIGACQIMLGCLDREGSLHTTVVVTPAFSSCLPHLPTEPLPVPGLLVAVTLGGNKCWQRCGERGSHSHCWWEWKLVQPLWDPVQRFLTKLKTELSHDLATPLFSICQNRTVTWPSTLQYVPKGPFANTPQKHVPSHGYCCSSYKRHRTEPA